MIDADSQISTTLKATLIPLLGFPSTDTDVSALAADLIETINDASFPGALVPVAAGSEVLILVVAASQGDWRRLAPLIKAFAGPTLTSFDGLPTPLPIGLPANSSIMSANPAVTGVIRMPSARKGQIAALRALARLRETLGRAPDLRRDAAEPTSWLLARFQDHLNLGRIEPAGRVLSRLRSELRLDALNLGALDVQLKATAGDWPAIVAMPIFAGLCLARRTPATTRLLLEALYRVHVEGSFEAGDAEATRSQYENIVRASARPMLSPPPGPVGDAVWRLLALEAWIDPARVDLADAVATSGADLSWLSSRIAGPGQTEPTVEPAPQQASLDVARTALTELGRTDSLDAVAAALSALSHLSADDLARLQAAEPFRSLLNTAEAEAASVGLPENWTAWFRLIPEEAFTSALDVARAGQSEWPIDKTLSDPVQINALLAAIEAAQNDAVAAERSSHALPHLVAWLQRDPEFPRPALRPIYSVLLTLLVLGPARGRTTHESSYLLIHALLATGLDLEAYRELIADVRELSGDGFGVDMAYWILEVVEDFMRAATPDNAAREDFLHEVLSKLAPLYARLSTLQREMVGVFALELGWSLAALGVTPAIQNAATVDGLAARFAGKRIAIYSLTEATARQAKAAIEKAAPGVWVDCNSDHGGTQQLKALAENADLFVMVWQSAKHAATDFIRANRSSDRPLIYAAGRGVSSILRAIDDHVSAKC